MELQIQNEKIDIKRSIGNKKKTSSIEKDFILPDNKPDIIKVQNENANIYILKKEIMENKVKLEGGICLRTTYLTEEGKSKVLKIEETFGELIEIEGINENSFIDEKIEVKSIETRILNERKIHFKIDFEIKIKASQKENIEFIHEINQIHQLQILNKNIKINNFVGRGETKINLQEKMEIENLQESIEVIKMQPIINNIEKKMSYNKVLVKADCLLKCLYITEAGIIYMAKKEVPIMGFLDINNVEDTNECNVEISLKNLSVTENANETKCIINIDAEFNVSGYVYQEREIKLVEDLYCLNNKIQYSKRKVCLENEKQCKEKTDKLKEKVLVEDINQIYDTECKIINYKQSGKYVEGDMKLTYLYNSFENPGLNKKEEIIKFQIQLEDELNDISLEILNINSTILPDSSVDTEIEIKITNNAQKKQEIELINEISVEDENDDDDGYSMVIYFVKPNDSLWKIAKRFKSTVEEIVKLNDIENEEKIQIGDKLYIPRAM